ncbi:protein kinase domain-containing protein [Bacillus sp. V33-4]|uniref:protein kinase domain-containing protein n=1 Tax=Bacillus sp. V33-4 TaxID=2054169 RepID=UPI000C771B4E|nr:protein kinase [Bacillus sp. V33-4]PLR83214.1 serine/threonine protein kinase [Bacillus sp. V33-4]
MMNNSLKNQFKVTPGMIVKGKWHGNRYTIIKELGCGANGIVYLAEFQNQHVAIKMSENGMSITSEVNVLKSFAKAQGLALGPSLLDVDDWETKAGKISFYTMEYIHGPDFMSFIQQKGKAWVSVLVLQLLSDLEKLHQKGWVFGDLKPENLIITGPPPTIRCIDVGGTTIQGRAIKEFTEFYDRGYWGLGSRKADPAYDLFAAGMIIINSAYPKRFVKTTGGLNQLISAIRQKNELQSYENIIKKALEGQYQSAAAMRHDIIEINRRDKNKAVPHAVGSRGTRQARSRQTYKKQKKKGNLTETVLVIFVIFILYAVYVYGQIL